MSLGELLERSLGDVTETQPRSYVFAVFFSEILGLCDDSWWSVALGSIWRCPKSWIPPNALSHGWPWLSIETHDDHWGSPMTSETSQMSTSLLRQRPGQQVNLQRARPAAVYIGSKWDLATVTTQPFFDVSWNRGTPKSSPLRGFETINHPFWSIPNLRKPTYSQDDEMERELHTFSGGNQ